MALKFRGLKKEPYKNFVPVKQCKSIIRGYDLITESVGFLEKFYRGVIYPRAEFDFDRFVSVSEDSFAYFFKILLKEIHGRGAVQLNAHQFDNKLTVELTFNKGSISHDRYEEILTIASEAGFEATETDYGIYMEAKAFITSATKIFSIMPKRVYLAFAKVFSEKE
jgi:hypothetical protein